jgi:hypothetical protein
MTYCVSVSRQPFPDTITGEASHLPAGRTAPPTPHILPSCAIDRPALLSSAVLPLILRSRTPSSNTRDELVVADS